MPSFFHFTENVRSPWTGMDGISRNCRTRTLYALETRKADNRFSFFFVLTNEGILTSSEARLMICYHLNFFSPLLSFFANKLTQGMWIQCQIRGRGKRKGNGGVSQ
jgi:hypothetical protein